MTSTYKGIVQKGSKRGTALGYPTLNIPLGESEVSGVYAARVKIGEEWYEAAAFADPKRKVLEAYVIDFSADLYGWEVSVELFEKLRDSKEFADDVALRAAIKDDIQKVRAHFRSV